VREYAEAWRGEQLHRASTAEMVERTFRLHILPRLGDVPMAAVRPSHLRALVKDRSEVLEASTVHLVFGYLVSTFCAAVVNTYTREPDAIDRTRTPVDSALGEAPAAPEAAR
jgi:Phage integrase, N-terminal SAM-like domain